MGSVTKVNNMIKTLNIKDFILIDELEVVFDKGFNVITGETGAGKSIIIQAIDIAFGARASKDLIKTGKNRALIELTVSVDEDFSRNLPADLGLEIFDNEIVFSKEITENGSRSRVNGMVVTQDIIKTLRELLIDIHSQHMTYTYVQPKHHITLLDNYGKAEHKELLAAYKQLFSKYMEITEKLNRAKEKIDVSEQQIEFLKFQLSEIENAQIQNKNEDEELKEELNVLANSEKLKEYTYSAYWGLYGGEQDIISALGKIKSALSKAAEYDTKLADFEENITGAQETLRETAIGLRDYSEAMELDEARLNEVQERIDILEKLKRKYGSTLEEVLSTYEKLSIEMNEIDASAENVEELEQQKKEALLALKAGAEALSGSRLEIARELSQVMTSELEKLDMPKVRFSIDISPCDFNSNGADNVEFLISTNISEEPKPLAKIASGGEISRVMLAMKTIFANSDNINTVIFDEIDTGISGKASQAVAEEIARLAEARQIIAITHQPIIAAKSDRHFYVAKSQNEATQVHVYILDEENKIKAIAMLAAGDVTDDSVKFAKQLIYGC